MNRSLLSAGRLVYAILTGLALVAVSLNTALIDTVGEYTLQSGIAAAIATIIPLGVDRALARRRASGELRIDLPYSLLRFRLVEIAVLSILAAVTAFVLTEWLLPFVCLLFATSRLVYNDLETLWIASHRGTSGLGVALIVNGAVTAAGIYFGAPLGAEAMLALSSCGNLAAALLLWLVGSWTTGTFRLAEVTSEAIGFGASATLAVVYARLDLIVIAVVGIDLRAVAVYGIILRAYDTLSLIRGSIAQLEIRKLARLDERERFRSALMLGGRIEIGALALAVAGAAVCALAFATPFLTAWQGQLLALLLACAGIPMFAAHLPTSAIVYSDPRTALLFKGSVIGALSAAAIKTLLIWVWGVNGGVTAIAICELVSFFIFAALYSPGNQKGDVARFLVGPLISLGLSVALLILGGPR
ncbi:hypothetical protein [Microbacterium sp. 10M-3C3]|uniref:hypothetical protein n=1 Tax=Microbacterium sp. 10M-3C3 TaxID=2483401 RepID=UPI000F6323F2|nr:hypothetical protein [Microbacterium sp. 10M-3C3]